MQTESAISVRHVYFSYGSQEALKDVSLEVKEGGLFGLLGPNGGGKTTLFHLLTTLFELQRGEIEILGENVKRKTQEVRKHFGVIFQSPSLDEQLTVKENMLFHGRMYGLKTIDLEGEIEALAKELRFAKRLDDRAKVLSGGYKRRVEIAKALLPKPDILLMDEPSAGLDPVARRELWNLIANLRKERKLTILFTTHLMDEADLCDDVAILHHGKLVKQGTPEALKQEISGDVLMLDTEKPEELKTLVKDRFGLESRVVQGSLRVETEDASALMLQLLEGHREEIQSLHLRKPTLEDVFFSATGASLEMGDPS